MSSAIQTLSKTYLGLRILYLNLCLFVFLYALPFLYPLFDRSMTRTETVMIPLAMAFGVMLWVFPVLNAIGQMLCLVDPSLKERPRLVVVLGVLLDVVTLGLMIGHRMGGLPDRLSKFGLSLGEAVVAYAPGLTADYAIILLVVPLHMMSTALLLWYLRWLANYSGDFGLARRALAVFVIDVSLIVLWGAIGLFGANWLEQYHPTQQSVLLLAVTMLSAPLVSLILYGNLLAFLMSEIRKLTREEGLPSVQTV